MIEDNVKYLLVASSSAVKSMQQNPPRSDLWVATIITGFYSFDDGAVG